MKLSNFRYHLTLIWIAFVGVRFAVSITWKLVCEYRNICSSKKYSFYYQDPPNFANFRFFSQKSAFFEAKIVTLLKPIVWELCLRPFSSVFSFFKIKVAINEFQLQNLDQESSIRNPASQLFQISHKLENGQWCQNFLTWCHHQVFLTLPFFTCQV